jgi:hypothetical protein
MLQETGDTLREMNENGLVDLTDDQIDEVAEDRAAFAAAQWTVHNPVGQGGMSFFQDVMAKASHPNGPAWSIPLNKDMRKHGLASQRSANTRIDPMVARNVGGVYASDVDVFGETPAEAAGAEFDVLAQMTDEERYQMAVQRSLELTRGGNIANYDHDLSAFTNNQFNTNTNSMQSSISFNNEASRSRSISPMVSSVATKSFASTLPTSTITATTAITNNTAQPTPEHVSKSRQALLDLSMGLLDDVNSDSDVDDDAIAAFDAFDDKTNPTHNTLRQMSRHLHMKNEPASKRAKKLVAGYKSLSKKKNL